MHHLPAGPSRFARLTGALGRTAARGRRAVSLHPRRAVPLLVLGVVLAVLGIAAPVVPGAMTGRPGVSLDSSSSATAGLLRTGAVRMGQDGSEEPGAGRSGVRSTSTSTSASARSSAGGSAGPSSPPATVPPATVPPAMASPARTVATGSAPMAGRSAGTAASTAAGSPAAGRTTGSAAATTTSPPPSAGSTSTAPTPPPSDDVGAPALAAPPTALVTGADDPVLAAVNSARAGAGCAALSSDAGLTDLAQGHSTDMARSGVLGLSGLTRRTAVVAQGSPDAAAVVAGWLADPGARAVLLDCDRTSLGAGEVTGPGGPWWTAVLA